MSKIVGVFCMMILGQYVLAGSGYTQSRQQLREMETVLQSATADAFLHQIAAQQWNCPRIPSR